MDVPNNVKANFKCELNSTACPFSTPGKGKSSFFSVDETSPLDDKEWGISPIAYDSSSTVMKVHLLNPTEESSISPVSQLLDQSSDTLMKVVQIGSGVHSGQASSLMLPGGFTPPAKDGCYDPGKKATSSDDETSLESPSQCASQSSYSMSCIDAGEEQSDWVQKASSPTVTSSAAAVDGSSISGVNGVRRKKKRRKEKRKRFGLRKVSRHGSKRYGDATVLGHAQHRMKTIEKIFKAIAGCAEGKPGLKVKISGARYQGLTASKKGYHACHCSPFGTIKTNLVDIWVQQILTSNKVTPQKAAVLKEMGVSPASAKELRNKPQEVTRILKQSYVSDVVNGEGELILPANVTYELPEVVNRTDSRLEHHIREVSEDMIKQVMMDGDTLKQSVAGMKDVIAGHFKSAIDHLESLKGQLLRLDKLAQNAHQKASLDEAFLNEMERIFEAIATPHKPGRGRIIFTWKNKTRVSRKTIAVSKLPQLMDLVRGELKIIDEYLNIVREQHHATVLYSTPQDLQPDWRLLGRRESVKQHKLKAKGGVKVRKRNF